MKFGIGWICRSFNLFRFFDVYRSENFYGIKEIGKRTNMDFLTRKEELILLAILKLGPSASLVKIREQLISSTGRKWSVGNVYVPLDRMNRLGYLSTRIGNPTAQRGGKAVKYYFLTRKGNEELVELKKVQDKMWAGIHGLVFDKE
jgi:PadR family transcriptional regulator PadR